MCSADRLEQGAGPPAERLAHALVRISSALRHHAQRAAQARRLTPTQGEILVWLRTRPGASVGDVARGLAITAATVSDAVDALVAKGLVGKRRGEADARSVQLRLTARGRREAERAAGWADFLIRAAERLPEADQQALLAALIRIIKTLQERGQIPVSRMCVSCSYFRPWAYPGSVRPHHCALVNAPFGDAFIRVDCPDHVPAPEADAAAIWQAWLSRSSFHDKEASR
jgi:DNA-binding MarR family transcriptional regulator